MLQSSQQPDEEFFQSFGEQVKLDAAGNVFIHLKNQEVIGLSPLSLSELLKVPILEAKDVMKEAVKIAVESDIQSASEMSNILMNIMDIIDQEKAEAEGKLPAFIEDSLLSIEDIGEILDVHNDFAEKVFRAYKHVINSEEDLEKFTDFFASYLHEHHMGQFPKEADRNYQEDDNTSFDSQKIDNILAQEAPQELRSEEELLKEQYTKEAKATLTELLSITKDDAQNILENPAHLQELLALDTQNQAEKIIRNALNGNQAPLLEALNSQSNNLLGQLSDHAIRDVLDPSMDLSQYQQTTPSSDAEILPRDTSPQNVSEIIDDPISPPPENAETISDDDAGTDEDLPETLEETLRLCFSLRQRITSKSLAEIFDIWGTDISMALGRFIIEEGKYGGEGENTKRIVSEEQLERMISDIAAAGDLKTFIRKYLKMVNDQVQSMYYGSTGAS